MSLQYFSRKLSELSRLLQQKNHKVLIEQAHELLVNYSNQPDLHHVLALGYKMEGKVKNAIIHFEKSLSLKPNQEQVHNNLGNTYVIEQAHERAQYHYCKAIELKPNFVDPYKNLALSFLSLGQHQQALEALEASLKLSPRDVSILTALGNVWRHQEQLETALEYYQKALQIEPNYVNALHNVSLVYKLLEKHELALATLAKAKQLAPRLSEIDFNIANILVEKNNYQQAEQYYWSALKIKPNDIGVHQTLNELYWQLGNKEAFGRSYAMAIAHLPKDANLRGAYAESLLDAKQLDLAQKIVEESVKLNATPKLLHVQGKLHSINQDNTLALASFEQALEHSFEINIALDMIGLAIVEQQYERALSLISAAEKLEPFNQLLLAYKGVCWRLIGDERHYWLNDYDTFVKPYNICVPNGYANLNSYMEELKSLLLSMHKTEHEPLKQTLKHGTQTPGRLLYKDHHLIRVLKASLSEVVAEHIGGLPNDSSHPLLSRKAMSFNFSGSWSVKLKANGFHVNHVHPQGWLSSAFYVSVPDLSDTSQASSNAGAIKFGETSLNLGDREVVSKVLQPKAGMLALFPSYVWHGTIPFNGKEGSYRLTSPFDVVPVSK